MTTDIQDTIQPMLEQPVFERLRDWYAIGPVQRATLEEFVDQIVAARTANLLVTAMSDPVFARAMDQYYERKWAHRFD